MFSQYYFDRSQLTEEANKTYVKAAAFFKY